MCKEFVKVSITDMYKLEKSEQSLFRVDNWCFALDVSRTGGRLKRGKLFLLIGSLISRGCATRRSVRNVSYCSCPIFLRLHTVLTTDGSARSLLSRTRRSLLSSVNGFPISSISLHVIEECHLPTFHLLMSQRSDSFSGFPINA